MKEKQPTKWRRLDNTAKLFPVIANENLSNVFRVSSTLKREIKPELLQRALDDILPWFDGFRVKLRRGFFWYYFETNKRRPLIEKEITYPCKYIDPHCNQLFLFRVSYYNRRINLEVFHAITDGMGAVNFLKELTYRYLQLEKKPPTERADYEQPSQSCILSTEDSYLKHYKKMPHKAYSTKAAYQLKGDRLYLDTISVIHGYVELAQLKKVCKKRDVSITKYLAALLIWSIYIEYLNCQPNKNPICINIPINLRAFFESVTTRNFFAVTAIHFLSDGKDYTFEDILTSVSKQMDENIVKEKLEKTISYNVSSEKKWYVRMIPLAIKWIGLNFVFWRSAKASTITLSNLGVLQVLPKFEDEIEQFHFVIGVSKRQKMKCGISSYKDQVVVTFTSVLEDSYVQKAFFRFLAEEGIPVTIESNGVVNEKM